MANWPQPIRDAVLCGELPPLRDWQDLPVSELTDGELVLRFAADYLVFPEGPAIGKPLVLDKFQQAFVLSVFDAPEHCYKGILSVARRNGKNLVMSVIVLAFVIGPHAKRNTLVRSAAMTRDQAGLLYRLMELTLRMSPNCAGLYRTVESSKRIVGLRRNVEYRALSRDARSGHGQAIYVLVVDECGQIDAPFDTFLEMLFSSQGTYTDARSFLISTQAPGDAAFLSLELDAAAREAPSGVVAHLYTAPTEELEDQDNWHAANPGLRGGYRSTADIARQAAEAARIPSKQPGFLNLFLNRRVAREGVWLAPEIWKNCADPPDPRVAEQYGVHVGLDLSRRNDLCAAVFAAGPPDGSAVHLWTTAFTPMDGLRERSQRDRAPYEQWVHDGYLVAVPGRIVEYDYVADYLRNYMAERDWVPHTVEYDQWHIEVFRVAAQRNGFAPGATWNGVAQTYRNFSPRLDSFESALLTDKVRHGGHPVLNMGAATAVVSLDTSNNKKLDKGRPGARIDAVVAAVMAAYPLVATDTPEFDVEALIG